MSTILFTAGAKGGTGKSTAVRFLITYLRDHGNDPLLLDLDDENRTLSRFLPEAVQVEIKKKSSHDVLIERALNGDPLIIADLKAGTGREVLDWWLDVPFEDLRSQGVDFICLASVTSSPDSVQSFLIGCRRSRTVCDTSFSGTTRTGSICPTTTKAMGLSVFVRHSGRTTW